MRYFKLAQNLNSPDEKGSGNKMSEELLKYAQWIARKKFGKPIKINSGATELKRKIKTSRWETFFVTS